MEGTGSKGDARLGVLVIVLLLLAWAVVLVPSILGPRIVSSPIDGVRSFERSMGILESARRGQDQPPGRWVMLPKGMREAPQRRRSRVVRRRRQNFQRLVLAAATTLILGLIPGLRALWMAHIALDVALALYVLQLRRWRLAELQRARVVHPLPTEQPHPDRAASQSS